MIAWLWARTVKSPNPAFAGVDVPLASTFMLSTKSGKEAYVEPVIKRRRLPFRSEGGQAKGCGAAKDGTKLARGANFRCLMSGTPIRGDYIKAEGKAGRMGARLMAMVVEGERGRKYLAPTLEQEAAANNAKPQWQPELTISGTTQYLGLKPYGIERFEQLFTDRQLVALATLSDLIVEMRRRLTADATAAGISDDHRPLSEGGTGITAYAEALSVYLAFALDKTAEYGCTIVPVVHKGRSPERAVCASSDPDGLGLCRS